MTQITFKGFKQVIKEAPKKASQTPFLGRMAMLPRDPVKSMRQQIIKQIQYKPVHTLKQPKKIKGSAIVKEWRGGAIS